MSVKMLSLYIATLFVLVGLYSAVEESCSRFRLRQDKYTFDAQKISYSVGVVKHDGITFKLKIKHADDSTIIKSPDADLTSQDGEYYFFELNQRGKQQLQKKRQICRHASIAIEMTFQQTVEPYPKLAQLINGDFSCVASNFSAPILKLCKELPNIAGRCRCRDSKIVRTYRNGERGYLNLNVSRLINQELTIGLSSPVKMFKINGRIKQTSNECNTMFHFTRRGSRHVYKSRRFIRIWYSMKVDADVPIPEIQYISYGNTMCRTSCGAKPLCSTPPPQTSVTRPISGTTKPTTETVIESETEVLDGDIILSSDTASVSNTESDFLPGSVDTLEDEIEDEIEDDIEDENEAGSWENSEEFDE